MTSAQLGADMTSCEEKEGRAGSSEYFFLVTTGFEREPVAAWLEEINLVSSTTRYFKANA